MEVELQSYANSDWWIKESRRATGHFDKQRGSREEAQVTNNYFGPSSKRRLVLRWGSASGEEYATVLACGPLLSVSGNMAEVTLCHSALELTAFNQLISLASQGLGMTDAYDRGEWMRAGRSRHITNTQQRDKGVKEKNGAITFPNILFGSWRRRGNHR